MKAADLQRVRDIDSGRKWRNVDAIETEFITADEVVNLTIRAGTLTLKERDVINHHIVATIRMLEQLPWPKHLTRMPEYAGGHIDPDLFDVFVKQGGIGAMRRSSLMRGRSMQWMSRSC